MKTELAWLALLMGAVTYPWRAVPLIAPGMHRLPSGAQEYFRLVGPAVLAALAAVDVMVILDAERTPSFHVGVEWLAVGVCLVLVSARRSLLVGLVAAALITTVVRALNLA